MLRRRSCQRQEHPVHISARLIFPVIAFAAVLGGCVSIDSRALREKPSSGSMHAIVGTYQNFASYRSKGEFVADENLSGALGLGRVEAGTVTLTRPTASQLKLEFKDGQSTKAVQTYVDGAGLVIRPEGRFEISVPVGCGGRDSPGFGCGTKTVTLFVNASGNLAAIDSGGGAGLLGVIPFAVYAKTLAIFPRLPAAE
jgi:hypothetical protein